MANELTERYQHEKPALEKALKAWREQLVSGARQIDSNAQISGRVKSHRSLIGKAFRKSAQPRRWEDFGDLVGLKAIFPTARGAEVFTDWLLGKSEWSPDLDRKTGSPDELKYETNQFDLIDPAITDTSGNPIKVEVQVRTAASDAWYVVDHRLKYKGIVPLPEELQRKLNRLIVLTELFDEEVEAVLARQAELPEYAAARLYTDLTGMYESMFPDQTIASRPERLFELLLDAYSEEELESLRGTLSEFFSAHKTQLIEIIRDHHHGSADYVEHRDWLYYEPETLLIAERAMRAPSLLTNTVEFSNYEALVTEMHHEFKNRLST